MPRKKPDPLAPARSAALARKAASTHEARQALNIMADICRKAAADIVDEAPDLCDLANAFRDVVTYCAAYGSAYAVAAALSGDEP